MPGLDPGTGERLPRDLNAELMATVPQWRAKGPLELDESRDWGFQTAFQSDLGGFTRKVRQNEPQKPGQACRVERTRVILTFPPR